jgi:hypothetical protein
MKTFLPFSLVVVTLALVSGPVLRAQDTPPPPEQLGPQDQGAPPDQMAPPDQGPPPDQGAPTDQADPGDQDDSGASFQTFYDQLSSQGSWVQTDNYGYVWQPDVQDPDWRPYSNGHWVYTDEGWTWVADASEPWGWATYHYGRWVNIEGEGWVWVPGYTWAPAWVSWRYGGGYCGWAPLPPETTVGIDFGGVDIGFHIGGDCDTAYDIGAGYYNFVPVGYIGARDYRPYYVNRYNNYTIINNTRNVTNINVNNAAAAGRFGRVTTGGPNFATINAQSRTPVQRASLVRSNRLGNASLQGNQLAVYAPRVQAAGSARPRNVTGNLSAARVNRGADISRPLTVNSRLAPAAASPQQVQAAQAAQARIPHNARIATSNTQLARPLTTPLTSLPPHAETRVPASANPAIRPAATSNQGYAPSHPSANRSENPYTGGNPAPENQVRHVTPSNEQENRPAAISHPAESTPPRSSSESVPPVHSGNTAVQHESAPVEHHASQPSEQREFAPVQHQQAAPTAQREIAPVEHHESAPVEHHEASAPAFHPAAAPAAVHQASAPPPAAAGKPQGKPGGKPDDKK